MEEQHAFFSKKHLLAKHFVQNEIVKIDILSKNILTNNFKPALLKSCRIPSLTRRMAHCLIQKSHSKLCYLLQLMYSTGLRCHNHQKKVYCKDLITRMPNLEWWIKISGKISAMNPWRIFWCSMHQQVLVRGFWKPTSISAKVCPVSTCLQYWVCKEDEWPYETLLISNIRLSENALVHSFDTLS